MVVLAMAKVDEALDEVLYRPAVVKAFTWLPRWWLCDLARLSMVLDDRWNLGYWERAGIAPGRPCEACRRRASIHIVGGTADEFPEDVGSFLDDRPVYLCGWCHLEGEINVPAQLEAALADAGRRSVSWRWHWAPTS